MYSTVYWKGTDIALKGFSIAVEKRPNLRLVAFSAAAPSSELPLPANAEYVIQPDQDKIKDYYSKCDAWLLASRSELEFRLRQNKEVHYSRLNALKNERGKISD